MREKMFRTAIKSPQREFEVKDLKADEIFDLIDKYSLFLMFKDQSDSGYFKNLRGELIMVVDNYSELHHVH